MPLSTITAWQSQFATWAPDLHVVTYIGSAKSRAVAREYEFGPSVKKLKMNVLLTTYEITLRDVKELGEIKWQMLMVDEVRISRNGSGGGDTACNTRFPGTSVEELGESAVRSSEGFLGRVQGSHHGYSASEQREGSVDAHLFMSRGSAHVSPGQSFLR